MKSYEAAVRIKQLGKCYQIYDQPVDRLKQALWRGKKQFFREFWAIRDVSLEIGKGETVGIIGSNGSGKSTLLQLICGILNPTTGEIEVNGRVAGLLELGAGFNPEFTGKENIFMNAAIMGLSLTEIQQRYDEIAAFADIGDFIHQPVKTYSSGMYVRLAFATAINVSADILVVDEALAVGDMRFRQKCMKRLKAFCQNGTVILVSHDTEAVIELCSRALWFEKGQLWFDGSPRRAVEKYVEFMYASDNPEPSPSLLPDHSKALPGSPEPSVLLQTEGFIPIGESVSQYGDRRAVIESVRFVSEGVARNAAASGAPFEISFIIRCEQAIQRPIAGYMIRDRLGRIIFGDNTDLTRKRLAPFLPNRRYRVGFKAASWPNIVAGEYVLTIAVGDGTMEQLTACHWLHDVLILNSLPQRMPVGIFSIADTELIVEDIE